MCGGSALNRRLLAGGFWLAIISSSEAQTTFPYRVQIEAAAVAVYSGPGKQYYRTQYLPAGVELEVHRRDPEGWLAIRPPKAAFSWVRKDWLEPTSRADVSRVTRNQVPVLVGSHLQKPREFIYQIQLNRNERVRVMEERIVRKPGGGSPVERWSRIEPPAGEFRWVRAKDLRPHPIARTADKTARSLTQWVQSSLRNGGLWRRDLPPPASSLLGPSSGRFTPSPHSAARTISQARPALPPVSQPPLEQSPLEKLRQRVSETAIRRLGEQNWTPLKAEAEQLAKQVVSTAEKQQAETLRQRIEQLEALQKQWRGAGSGEPAAPKTLRWNSLDNPPSADKQDYDGVGWLHAVHSAQSQTPPYALLDEKGRVAFYVSPAAGVELNAFLKKRIGVYGRRGYAQDLKKPHVTARLVIDLER